MVGGQGTQFTDSSLSQFTQSLASQFTEASASQFTDPSLSQFVREDMVEGTKKVAQNNGGFLGAKKSVVRRCGHGEPAVERKVKKKGPNFNRK